MSSTAVASDSTLVKREFVFDQRAAIALFRGAGGLLNPSVIGPGPTGIDTLNARIAEAFPDHFITSQVFDSFEGNIFSFSEVGSQRGQEFLSQFSTLGSLTTIGYSGGGLSAIRLAGSQAPRPVDLVVQIDSYVPLTNTSPENKALPDNVLRGINYFQIENRFNPFRPGFDLLDLQGTQNIQGAENINAEVLFNDRNLTHRNIESYAPLQDRILQDIEASALSGLAFDPEGQLELSGGTAAVNNLLRLAPGADGTSGSAFIAESIDLNPTFSFQSRFEFRLPPPVPDFLSGLAFEIRSATSGTPTSGPNLALTFDPLAPNTVSLFRGDLSDPLAQVTSPLNLATGQPLTAWVNYDGMTDQLAFYLSDTLTQPSAPLLSYAVDLLSLVGPQAQFGFTTQVGGSDRNADLLSWQLSLVSSVAPPPPPTTPTYLELLNQAFLDVFGVELPTMPLTIGGIEVPALFEDPFWQQPAPDIAAALRDILSIQGQYDSVIPEAVGSLTAAGQDALSSVLKGDSAASTQYQRLQDQVDYYLTQVMEIPDLANPDIRYAGLDSLATVGSRESISSTPILSEGESLISDAAIASAVDPGLAPSLSFA